MSTGDPFVDIALGLVFVFCVAYCILMAVIDTLSSFKKSRTK